MVSLDLATSASERLASLKIPASLIAKLSGVSDAHLSNWLNHRVPFENSLAVYVDKNVRAVEKLIEMTRPLPLDFKQHWRIKELLSKIEDGDLSILIFEGPLPAADEKGSTKTLMGGLLALAGG
jgi:hypothetical protein